MHRNGLKNGQINSELRKYAADYSASYQFSNAIQDIKKEGNRFYIFTEFEGLPYETGMIWEPLDQVNNDLPDY